MTEAYHSIWLMPCSDQEKQLASIVRELSEKFKSPVFQPHLTLVEDMPRSCEDLKPLLEGLAEGMASFQSPIETVEESKLYYRSLYARFPITPPLKALKERSISLFGVGSLDAFMPHVSLAYGVEESAEKTLVINELQDSLRAMDVRFDRVCIVSSSQKTPIEEWKIRHDAYLTA